LLSTTIEIEGRDISIVAKRGKGKRNEKKKNKIKEIRKCKEISKLKSSYFTSFN